MRQRATLLRGSAVAALLLAGISTWHTGLQVVLHYVARGCSCSRSSEAAEAFIACSGWRIPQRQALEPKQKSLRSLARRAASSSPASTSSASSELDDFLGKSLAVHHLNIPSGKPGSGSWTIPIHVDPLEKDPSGASEDDMEMFQKAAQKNLLDKAEFSRQVELNPVHYESEDVIREIRSSASLPELIHRLEVFSRLTVFTVSHALTFLDQFAEQRFRLSSEELSQLGEEKAVQRWILYMNEQLPEAKLNARLVAQAMRGVALYEDHVPALRSIVPLLCKHASDVLPVMKPKDVSLVIAAIAALHPVYPDMLDELLPAVIDREASGFITHRMQIIDRARYEVAVRTIVKDVPDLREYIPLRMQ